MPSRQPVSGQRHGLGFERSFPEGIEHCAGGFSPTLKVLHGSLVVFRALECVECA
jgi:hypothetical protein